MTYTMYDRARRLSVYIMVFLIIFLMVNIFVQSIQVQEVDASIVWVEAVGPYLIEMLVTFLGVTGMVYADQALFDTESLPELLWHFMQSYYDDYMANEISMQWENFLEWFNGEGQCSYNDIPQEVRESALDFASTITAGIDQEGMYDFYQLYTASYQGPVEIVDIPIPLNSTYEIIFQTDNPGFYMCTGGAGNARQWHMFRDENDLSITYEYHKSDIISFWYTAYGPEIENYNNVSVMIQNEGIYVDGIRIEPNPLHNPIYTDIPDSTLTLFEGTEALVVTSVYVDSVDGQAIDNFGEDWRSEYEDELKDVIVPPWVLPGQDLYIPDGTTVDDLTGEGVDVGDVTIPSDTSVDYEDDYAGDMTGVGDVPLDIPAEIEGTIGNELMFDWSSIRDITTVFPFSIPWDIQRILLLFDHYESEPPEYEIPVNVMLLESDSQEVLLIKFDWLEPYVEFIRWMLWIICVMSFIVFVLRHFVQGG